ncbi:MAG: transglutaminase-like cysteine peptidase [Cellvibrionaceae bacterium]
MLDLFRQITIEINDLFEYRTDRELYGKDEWWTDLKPVGDKLLGDCEDYCITIANKCLDSGIPRDSLVLHLVATRKHPDHIILEYKGWFADCNTKGLMKKPPYKLISHRRLSEKSWIATPRRYAA